MLLLASMGLTHVLINKWRFFNCYICTGFWTGSFLSCFYFSSVIPFSIFNSFVIFSKSLCFGLAAGFLSMFAAAVIEYLEAQTYGKHGDK